MEFFVISCFFSSGIDEILIGLCLSSQTVENRCTFVFSVANQWALSYRRAFSLHIDGHRCTIMRFRLNIDGICYKCVLFHSKSMNIGVPSCFSLTIDENRCTAVFCHSTSMRIVVVSCFSIKREHRCTVVCVHSKTDKIAVPLCLFTKYLWK